MKKGTVFVLSGPAGSGKSTVRERLMSKGLNFHYSISDTTRKPRAGERDGVDYGFVTREKFEGGIKNGAYYDVDRGAEPDIIITSPEKFYDRAALTDYINSLY